MNVSYFKQRQFLIPTALWAVFLALGLTLLGTGERKHNPLWRTLIQWDGQHYVSIARSGYEVYPCSFSPEHLCGNVGWFPMYPLVGEGFSRFLGLFGLDFRWGMLVTSWLCIYLALLVLFRLIALRFTEKTATASLAALLLFPSSFYFLTAFPYSLFLLLTGLVFVLLQKERYLLAAVPAGLLAATYPSGICIALPLGWILISRWRDLAAHARLSLVAAVASTGFALLLYALYYWVAFDDFFLYLRFQSAPWYAHEAAFPFLTIYRSFVDIPLNHPISISLLFVIPVAILFYRKRIPVTWQIFMFAILLFTPTAGTTTSYYRHVIVAFPLFVMIGAALNDRWRRWLLPIYAVASIILMWTVFLKYYKLGGLM